MKHLRPYIGVCFGRDLKTAVFLFYIDAVLWNAGKCNNANNLCGCDWDGGDCCGVGNDYSTCVNALALFWDPACVRA